MNAKSLVAAVFLFLFVLFFTYGKTEDSGLSIDAVTPRVGNDEPNAALQLWPVGAVLLGMIYLRQEYFNPRSVAVIAIAAVTLMCLYALTDSREAFKGLMTLAIAGIVVYNSAGAVDLQYAVPFIFALTAIAYLLFYFELRVWVDVLLSVVLVGSIILLAKPTRFADSLATLFAAVLFASN